MRRLTFIFALFCILISCEYQDNGITSIDDAITSQYLIDGIVNDNLDIYIQNNQVFRYTGKPGVVEIPIGNANLSEYEPCFVLYVSSGPTPETTVSSAIISLDEMVVLSTSDFSKNDGLYSFEVCNLTSTSTINIEVRGEPGTYVNVWIEGRLKVLTDCDGNIYNTVEIGSQVWMVENLKSTKYNDCTPIQIIQSNPEWGNMTSPAMCWYNDDVNNKQSYGGLYNWYAVNTGKLCPTGWHVPSNEEWDVLISYLGFETAGSKLKETGTTHFFEPNSDATNESGFTGLPGGFRGLNWDYYDFFNIGYNGYWWTSTESSISNAYEKNVALGRSTVDTENLTKKNGFSIRCIKD